MDLTDEICRLLSRDTSLTARGIVDRLASQGNIVSRTEINAVLYCGGPWTKSKDRIPRWSARVGIGAPDEQEPMAFRTHDLQRRRRESDVADVPGLLLYPWQEEAYAAWRAAGRRGVVEAVTGTGKTRLGITVVIGHMRRGGKTLIVVPSVMLMKQWRDELLALLPQLGVGYYYADDKADFRSLDVIVGVVNSLRESRISPEGRPGLLIADECHRYGSAQNSLALHGDYESRLGLNATYARNDAGNAVYLDPYFGKVVFRISYVRALEERIVTPFVVALRGVRLDPQDERAYEAASVRASKTRSRLIMGYRVTSEPFGQFMKEVQNLAGDSGPGGDAQRTARRYLQAFGEQRTILADTPTKLRALRSLSAVIGRAKRTLIFTETIAAAKNVAALLRGLVAEAIHSEHNGAERQAVLKDFRAGKIRVLVAPRILDEGIDLPVADFGIIVAASKTRRQMIQRMGRVIRRSEGKWVAKFVILFAEGTTEDPERGAHQTFLDEIVDVAKCVKVFREGEQHALVDFLRGGWKRAFSDSFPRIDRQTVGEADLPFESVDESTVSVLANTRVHSIAYGLQRVLSCPWCGTPARLLSLRPDVWRLSEIANLQSVHVCPAGRAIDSCHTDTLPFALWSVAMKLGRAAK